MSDENERSVASAGSVAGDPVAWAVMCDGYVRSFFQTQEFAKSGIDSLRRTRRETLRIVPLYRQPQPAITDEERRAIGWAAEMMEVGSLPNSLNRDDARVLRSLLERLC